MTWIGTSWSAIVETIEAVGIIAGLFFSAQALRENAKALRTSVQFALTEQHREIWMGMISRPDLARVLEPDVDLEANPLTTAELTFVKLLLLQLDNSYRSIKAKTFDEPKNLDLDIQSFLSRPIPRRVWEMTRSVRDPEFVAFVEKHWNSRGRI